MLEAIKASYLECDHQLRRLGITRGSLIDSLTANCSIGGATAVTCVVQQNGDTRKLFAGVDIF